MRETGYPLARAQLSTSGECSFQNILGMSALLQHAMDTKCKRAPVVSLYLMICFLFCMKKN